MGAADVLELGACLLNAPFGNLLKQRLVTATWRKVGLTYSPSVYTLDEAIQAVKFFRGELDVRRELRPLCSLPIDWPEEKVAAGAEMAPDLVLVEVNSPVRICYDFYSLCRAEINSRYLVSLARKSDELHRIGNEWYFHGLMNGNHSVRVAAAEKLVKAIAEDDEFPDAELARSVLLAAVPHQRDFSEIVEGLAALRDLVNGPLALVTYTHQYMPDGRPLPWPPDFVELQMAAADCLGLPIFRPSEIVRLHGVARAMRDDRVHYQDEFVPVLATALFGFITEATALLPAEP